jgi:glycosyltransferase involved in cell wall biosynthesis
MKDNGYEVTTISADGPEVGEVLEEGVKHIVVPFTRKITPLHDLHCLITLIRIIKEIQPDIIHTHTPKAGLLGMMAGWFCNVPLRMHTVAGLPLMEATGIKRKLLEATEKITYACAQKIYPNSAGLEKFLIEELKVNAKKVKIIGKGSSNGIDTDFFRRTADLENQAIAIRKQFGAGPEDVIFSFVGRIVRDKGIVELVRSFKAITDGLRDNVLPDGSVKRAFLLLVGPFEQALDPLPHDVVTFLEKDKQVILAGFQRDVRPWMMASDIFVFPSYREGFPNVVMQSCLLQIPVIVSDINGCNELVHHHVSGLVVPPKDIQSLHQAMSMLLDDAHKRKTFSTAAYDFVFTNFQREVVWEELRKEYIKMLRGQ